MENFTRYFVAILVFLSSASLCKAQEITLVPKDYIFHNMNTGGAGGDRVYYFIVDGSEPQRIGYFGQRLKKYMQDDTVALKYLSSYATHQSFKLVTTITTVGFFSAFAISNLNDKRVSTGNTATSMKAKGALYASIASFGVNLVLRLIHPKSIQKAVNSYNQQVAHKGPVFNNLNFDMQRINRSRQISLGLNFSF